MRRGSRLKRWNEVDDKLRRIARRKPIVTLTETEIGGIKIEVYTPVRLDDEEKAVATTSKSLPVEFKTHYGRKPKAAPPKQPSVERAKRRR